MQYLIRVVLSALRCQNICATAFRPFISNRIDHCVAGCITCYLPQEKLSPTEAKEVSRVKLEVLLRFPKEIIFPKVDNGSYTIPKSF